MQQSGIVHESEPKTHDTSGHKRKLSLLAGRALPTKTESNNILQGLSGVRSCGACDVRRPGVSVGHVQGVFVFHLVLTARICVIVRTKSNTPNAGITGSLMYFRTQN